MNLKKKKIISILNQNFLNCYPDNYLRKLIRINNKTIFIGKTKFNF